MFHQMFQAIWRSYVADWEILRRKYAAKCFFLNTRSIVSSKACSISFLFQIFDGCRLSAVYDPSSFEIVALCSPVRNIRYICSEDFALPQKLENCRSLAIISDWNRVVPIRNYPTDIRNNFHPYPIRSEIRSDSIRSDPKLSDPNGNPSTNLN